MIQDDERSMLTPQPEDQVEGGEPIARPAPRPDDSPTPDAGPAATDTPMPEAEPAATVNPAVVRYDASNDPAYGTPADTGPLDPGPDPGDPPAGHAFGQDSGGQPAERAFGHDPGDPPAGRDPQVPNRNRFLMTFLVIGILLSALAGFAGGYLSTRVFPPPVSTTGPVTTTSTRIGSMAGAINVTQVAALAGPSVVAITTETLVRGQNLPQYVTSGAGSGVLYSADGLVVTNEHVITGAQRIIVHLTDGESYTATVIGADTRMDLAVLRIQATGLTPARIGDSANLSVGDPVVAIGNPLGELGGTVTNGIISALDRPLTLDNQTMTLLQTNAAVNPGNSGGGLFDRNGNLIGIVVAKTSAVGIEGIAFAIPINAARPIVDELIQNGFISGRINLGLTLADIDTQQELRFYGVSERGVYVVRAAGSGSAAIAGLQNGDRIVSIAGEPVEESADVLKAVERHQVGDQMSMVVNRDGSELSLTMTLIEEQPPAR